MHIDQNISTKMSAHPKFSLLIFSFLTLVSLSVGDGCHPSDKIALLKIKNSFPNATTFDTWDPDTNCCRWQGVICNDTLDWGGPVNTVLVAGDNAIDHIPSAVGDLPFLTTLGFFSLPNLVGSIPRSLTKLTRLQFLYLSSNRLSGPIPEFFGQMKSLETIDLANNSFSGSIPASLSLLPNLNDLQLQMNKLTGSIPESFSAFSTGMRLKLFDNLLSGPIPSSLGQANLTTIDVSGNRFTGDASFLFGKHKPVEGIALRQNRFKFAFTNVDVPRALKDLDIAHNDIYGSLPKRLGRLRFESFNVSYNQLCGPIPSSRRLQRFGPSGFAHNKCLCGPPLASCL